VTSSQSKSVYTLIDELNRTVSGHRGGRIFPHLSHLLGSDWAAGLPPPRSVDEYLGNALAVAKRKWPRQAHWVGAL